MVRRPLMPLAVLAVTTVLALALAIPGGAAPAPRAHAAKSRSCGDLVTSAGVYRIKVAKGVVKCRTAKKVLRHFLATRNAPRHWDCRNGAAHLTAWSEACGSPYHSLYTTFRDKDFKKVIKAYFILDE